MSAKSYVYTLTGTSPASAITAQLGAASVPVAGQPRLEEFDSFIVEMDVTGGTGGTTDLTIDRSYDNGSTWHEWIRSAAVAATVTTKFSVCPSLDSTIYTVGVPAAASTAPVLALGVCTGGPPGQLVRVRATGGASTTVGATQTVRLIGIISRK